MLSDRLLKESSEKPQVTFLIDIQELKQSWGVKVMVNVVASRSLSPNVIFTA